jgi:hypothetical protein
MDSLNAVMACYDWQTHCVFIYVLFEIYVFYAGEVACQLAGGFKMFVQAVCTVFMS